MSTNTEKLAELGVSIWLDDLSKDRLTSGSLAGLMTSHNVVGVTSNPTIFAGAVAAGSDSYAQTIQQLKQSGATPEEAVFEVMISDVQGACDLMAPVYQASGGKDGRVSLEVSPLLAFDTEGTISQARDLWRRVSRENLMIKIPATQEGLPAITEVIGGGISVNVTLIFSVERYAEVIDAYCAGMSKALSEGIDISRIFSVASFFVSRVDTAIDPLLDSVGTPEAKALRSQAALANARLAHQLFRTRLGEEPSLTLVAAGMNPQRPLWASTGVKDPALPQDLYVTQLAVSDVVNTMPEKTLRATQDDGAFQGDQVSTRYQDAHDVMNSLDSLGIDVRAVTEELERDGVAKFVQSWHDLLGTIERAMNEE
jgi:transaldolase